MNLQRFIEIEVLNNAIATVDVTPEDIEAAVEELDTPNSTMGYAS